jgi:hypothetical protein
VIDPDFPTMIHYVVDFRRCSSDSGAGSEEESLPSLKSGAVINEIKESNIVSTICVADDVCIIRSISVSDAKNRESKTDGSKK